jgi:hypothetical protein
MSIICEVMLSLSEELYINVCVIRNGYGERTVRICKYQNIVNGSKKEKVFTVNVILILI